MSQNDLQKSYPIIYRVYSRVSNGLPPLPDKIFILDKVLPIEETRHYEFKEVTSKNPVSTIKGMADQYAVAFLNSEGGRIFWGVRDNRTVSGIVLNASQRDEIRRVVGEKLTGIRPPIAPTAYKIEFHPVRDENDIVENLYVVEMAIPRPNNTDLYFTAKDEGWIRIDGGKKRLTGPEMQQEILRRKGFQ
jgi:predicted HTH transcriptional regulator